MSEIVDEKFQQILARTGRLARIGALYVALHELQGRLESEVDGLTGAELSAAMELAPLGVSAMSAISGESALDVLARINPETVYHGYIDAGDHPLMPRLDGLNVTKEGPFPEVAHEVTFIELGANGIASGVVSAIGCDVARDAAVGFVECIYVRFKGGPLYRYWPFKDGKSRWADLVTVCLQMKQALPVSLTVGEYVERVLKTAHENDIAICEKLDGDKWVEARKPSQVAAERAANKGARRQAAPLPTVPATPGEGTEGENARGPEDVPSL